MSRLISTIGIIAAVLTGYAQPILTTTQLSRQLLTNNTAAGMRSLLNVSTVDSFVNADAYGPLTYDVDFWGDSLTAGQVTGTPTTYYSPGAIAASIQPMIIPHVHGYPGQTSTYIRQQFTNNGVYNHTAVIWAGRNDVVSTNGTYYWDYAAVTNNVAQMVSSLSNKYNYCVFGIINAEMYTNTESPELSLPAETNGSPQLSNILSLNLMLSNMFSPRYVDIRNILMANANTNSSDTNDIARGLIPGSLRSDHIHLNSNGYSLVATQFVRTLNSTVYNKSASGYGIFKLSQQANKPTITLPIAYPANGVGFSTVFAAPTNAPNNWWHIVPFAVAGNTPLWYNPIPYGQGWTNWMAHVTIACADNTNKVAAILYCTSISNGNSAAFRSYSTNVTSTPTTLSIPITFPNDTEPRQLSLQLALDYAPNPLTNTTYLYDWSITLNQ